jgi:hypothetical protein
VNTDDVPAFPDIKVEIVRDAVKGVSDDPTERDVILGTCVVAWSRIRGQVANAVVQIDQPLAVTLRDHDMKLLAYRGLHDSLRELAERPT